MESKSVEEILDRFGKFQPMEMRTYNKYLEEATQAINQLKLTWLDSILPEKIDDGDGWDITFKNCCPGDIESSQVSLKLVYGLGGFFKIFVIGSHLHRLEFTESI